MSTEPIRIIRRIRMSGDSVGRAVPADQAEIAARRVSIVCFRLLRFNVRYNKGLPGGRKRDFAGR